MCKRRQDYARLIAQLTRDASVRREVGTRCRPRHADRHPSLRLLGAPILEQIELVARDHSDEVTRERQYALNQALIRNAMACVVVVAGKWDLVFGLPFVILYAFAIADIRIGLTPEPPEADLRRWWRLAEWELQLLLDMVERRVKEIMPLMRGWPPYVADSVTLQTRSLLLRIIELTEASFRGYAWACYCTRNASSTSAHDALRLHAKAARHQQVLSRAINDLITLLSEPSDDNLLEQAPRAPVVIAMNDDGLCANDNALNQTSASPAL